jgi:cellulose synthase/poly-beta-1,6-N-acetylglucosamine synthase-like glycosyltransferase
VKIDAAPISTVNPDSEPPRMGELLVRLRAHAAAIKSAARRDCAIAVLVPCYNEAATVATVVAEFRAALPTATIYVYDNNSKDGTAEIAAFQEVMRRSGWVKKQRAARRQIEFTLDPRQPGAVAEVTPRAA